MSHAIVSCGVGSWYEKGVARLERSLIYHGYADALYMHKGVYPPGSPTHQEVPYGFKLAAIEQARNDGHDQVLWLDASAWAIGKVDPVFNRIETDGHYFWTSGYQCHEWCSDRCLAYFNTTREEARSIEMLYALCIGLDFRSERTRNFFQTWKDALKDGIFNGSWKREEGDLEAPEYQGHRHDQSAASLIAHKLGMPMDMTHTLAHLYEQNMPPTVALCFQGL